MKLPALLLPLLTLAACGDAPKDSLDAGWEAFRSRDFDAAAKHFEASLATIAQESAEYSEVAVARCRAMAHQGAKQAREQFQALAEKLDLGEDSYKQMVRELFTQGVEGLVEAVNVVHTGLEKFPDSKSLNDYLEKLKAEAAKAEGGEIDSALKGLGYS